ncbi:MAG: hypothetical protein P1V97_30945 [Planctomycetota bacterium]|nr:hypothetical protein [Planctomycetota bacterium]
MKSVLNHVAILVENIESVVEKKLFPTAHLGGIEDFEAEGTRELYIGPENQIGRVLLMQATGPGPYKTALDKRGPGLHHVALDVLSIDDFVRSLSGSGWLLHPKSLDFYKAQKLVFLCRPGVPILIEVQQVEKFYDDDVSFIEEMEFPFGENRLRDILCCDRLKTGDKVRLKIADNSVSIADF